MSRISDSNRRQFLKLGATAAASAAVGAPALLSAPAVLAADAKPLSFQLSWIKSIQYGGYFAGIENGSFGNSASSRPSYPAALTSIPSAMLRAASRSSATAQLAPLLIAREKGIPIKVIGTVFQKSPYAVISLAEKPIKTAKELKGKTIAVSTSGVTLVRHMIADAGLSPDDVNNGPGVARPGCACFRSDRRILRLCHQPGRHAETRGVKIYALNAQDLGIPETTGTIYAREDFLKDNKDVVVNFLKGAIQGWRGRSKNPEPTAKLMVDKYGAPGLNYRRAADRDQGQQALYRCGCRARPKACSPSTFALYRQDHRCLSQGRHCQIGHDGGRALRSDLHRRCALRLTRCSRSRVSRDIQVGMSPWSSMAVATA